MILPPTPASKALRSLAAGHQCLRLSLLDENGNVVSKASGFITEGVRTWQERSQKYVPEAQYLHTCWHVVTGINYHDPKTPNRLPNRTHIQVSGTNVSENQFGGQKSFTIPLYNSDNSPAWQQESEDRAHSDLNHIGIKVPLSLDIVRIPIQIPSSQIVGWKIGQGDVSICPPLFGEEIFICGYPHGFSAMGDTISPVFLKRAIASPLTETWDALLLDGAGAPGMSGGPVFQLQNYEWKVIGIYQGVLYPDYVQPGPSQESNDRHSALGRMYQLSGAIQSIQRANRLD